ncbi:MAG: maleylacetoacetate isomerase [Minwuiales bacterium]|nr:maleylacetoacetate isomerase [Minwuiales bacterium]
MKLYGYFRSSAAYRVRIALNLKSLSADDEYIHLQKGVQTMPEYLSVNPQGLVPALVDDGNVILQSLAICEYLDEQHPEPPLLPSDALGRARVRALAQAIACEIHPLNNLRVLKYLTGELGLAEDVKNRWYQHWIAEGFRGLEGLLTDHPGTGTYCHGNTPGLADVCLVPQVFNARRFDCDLSPYPTVVRIADSLNELPAFADAAPEKQPDAA